MVETVLARRLLFVGLHPPAAASKKSGIHGSCYCPAASPTARKAYCALSIWRTTRRKGSYSLTGTSCVWGASSHPAPVPALVFALFIAWGHPYEAWPFGPASVNSTQSTTLGLLS